LESPIELAGFGELGLPVGSIVLWEGDWTLEAAAESKKVVPVRKIQPAKTIRSPIARSAAASPKKGKFGKAVAWGPSAAAAVGALGAVYASGLLGEGDAPVGRR
jgi:hypothetical protein